MVASIQTVLEVTQSKLDDWFENAKRDYGVEGHATVRFDDYSVIIEGVDNGTPIKWSMFHYPCNVEMAGLDYYFQVWAAGE